MMTKVLCVIMLSMLLINLQHSLSSATITGNIYDILHQFNIVMYDIIIYNQLTSSNEESFIIMYMCCLNQKYNVIETTYLMQ